MRILWILLGLCPLVSLSQIASHLGGGRSAGLAHASVALADPWAICHNPAALTELSKPFALTSYEQRFLLKELGVSNFAFVLPLKNGAIGLSASHFGFELHHATTLGLSYSMKLSQSLSVGMQLHYQNQFTSEASTRQHSLFGQMSLFVKPSEVWQIGLQFYNPTGIVMRQSSAANVASTLRVGIAYLIDPRLQISAEIAKDLDFKETYKCGFEYLLNSRVALRTGVAFPLFTNSFGIGLRFKNWESNLSYEYLNVLGANANLSFQYSF